MRRVIAVTVAASMVFAVAAMLSGSPVASGRPFLKIGRAHAEHVPALGGRKPIFVLVLGSDSRESLPIHRGLSDSIHILGINPKQRSATLIGIPRDSYVPLASGGTGKINKALEVGGVDAAIATVERLSGLRFDYFAITGFNEMVAAVNEIGGLRIDLPYSFPGYSRTFQSGQRTLDGSAALEMARTRKSLRGGDFDRSMNQGRLMVAALTQFRTQFARNPTALFTWIGAGRRWVDTDLSVDELITLAFTVTDMSPRRVTNLVLTGSIGTASNGTSIVNLSSASERLFKDIAADGYIEQRDIPAQAQPANRT